MMHYDGKDIYDEWGEPNEECETLRTVLALYIEEFGCLSCGEVHHGACPPSETSTTGAAWFKTTQAINRFNAYKRENKRLRARVEELETTLNNCENRKSVYDSLKTKDWEPEFSPCWICDREHCEGCFHKTLHDDNRELVKNLSLEEYKKRYK